MTTDADHDVLREQVALYAIDALSGPERAAVEAHLRECDECAAELKTLLPVTGALAQLVPQHDPPAALRATILAAARRESRARRTPAALAPWLAAAAMFVLTAGLGLYVGQLREQARAGYLGCVARDRCPVRSRDRPHPLRHLSSIAGHDRTTPRGRR